MKIKKRIYFLLFFSIILNLFTGCNFNQNNLLISNNSTNIYYGKILKIDETHVYIQVENEKEIFKIEKLDYINYDKELYLKIYVDESKQIYKQEIYFD